MEFRNVTGALSIGFALSGCVQPNPNMTAAQIILSDARATDADRQIAYGVLARESSAVLTGMQKKLGDVSQAPSLQETGEFRCKLDSIVDRVDCTPAAPATQGRGNIVLPQGLRFATSPAQAPATAGP